MGIRLNKALTILNISLKTAVEFLKSQSGLEPIKEMSVNTKISDSQYDALEKRFADLCCQAWVLHAMIKECSASRRAKYSLDLENLEESPQSWFKEYWLGLLRWTMSQGSGG